MERNNLPHPPSWRAILLLLPFCFHPPLTQADDREPARNPPITTLSANKSTRAFTRRQSDSKWDERFQPAVRQSSTRFAEKRTPVGAPLYVKAQTNKPETLWRRILNPSGTRLEKGPHWVVKGSRKLMKRTRTGVRPRQKVMVPSARARKEAERLNSLAIAAYQQKRLLVAIQLWRQAARLDSTNLNIQNNLNRALQDHPGSS